MQERGEGEDNGVPDGAFGAKIRGKSELGGGRERNFGTTCGFGQTEDFAPLVGKG